MNTRRLVIAMDGGLVQAVTTNFKADFEVILLEYDVDTAEQLETVDIPWTTPDGTASLNEAFLSVFPVEETDPQIDNFLQERNTEP